MSKTLRLIFICSGNLCRSPMAAAVARKRLAEIGAHSQVLSMGMLGIVGRPADPLAIEVCAQGGIDLSDHVSQGVSLGMLAQADLVLCMEREQLEQLTRTRRDLLNVRLLSSYEGGSDMPDIDDPVGGSRQDFEACLARLKRGVEGVVRHVRLGLLPGAA